MPFFELDIPNVNVDIVVYLNKSDKSNGWRLPDKTLPAGEPRIAAIKVLQRVVVEVSEALVQAKQSV